MSDNRFGVGMIVMRVAIVNALFHEVTEASVTEPLLISRLQITAQLVDGDLQDKTWRLIAKGG